MSETTEHRCARGGCFSPVVVEYKDFCIRHLEKPDPHDRERYDADAYLRAQTGHSKSADLADEVVDDIARRVVLTVVHELGRALLKVK